jgi:cyclophilin family peptidyl-prolyl cis-trans isomerase
VPSPDKRQRKKENARAAREAREAEARKKKRMRSARNITVAVVVLVGGILLFNFLTNDDDKVSIADTSTTVPGDTSVSTTTVPVSAPDYALDPAKTYTALVKTSMGDIELELDTKNAPVAAGHFIKVAKDGTYNGSRWHRVVKDFVIQGGAPGGDPQATGDPSIVGEVPTDNYPVGSLAAAKTGDAPAGTFETQFFIVTGEEQGKTLPNEYARFGSVKSGMDVVKKIEAVEVNDSDDPKTKVTIDSITINES